MIRYDFQQQHEVNERLRSLDERINNLTHSISEVNEMIKKLESQGEPEKEMVTKTWSYTDAKKRMEELRKQNNESVKRQYRLTLKRS